MLLNLVLKDGMFVDAKCYHNIPKHNHGFFILPFLRSLQTLQDRRPSLGPFRHFWWLKSSFSSPPSPTVCSCVNCWVLKRPTHTENCPDAAFIIVKWLIETWPMPFFQEEIQISVPLQTSKTWFWLDIDDKLCKFNRFSWVQSQKWTIRQHSQPVLVLLTEEKAYQQLTADQAFVPRGQQPIRYQFTAPPGSDWLWRVGTALILWRQRLWKPQSSLPPLFAIQSHSLSQNVLQPLTLPNTRPPPTLSYPYYKPRRWNSLYMQKDPKWFLWVLLGGSRVSEATAESRPRTPENTKEPRTHDLHPSRGPSLRPS